MSQGGAPIALAVLTNLVGQTIDTVKGRPNTILRIEGINVIVGTKRSPAGKPVPIEWVQDALDRLWADGEIEVSVPALEHRSAFVAAVLLTLPGVRATADSPPRLIWANDRGRKDD